MRNEVSRFLFEQFPFGPAGIENWMVFIGVPIVVLVISALRSDGPQWRSGSNADIEW
jgi:hypothetical protein